MKTPDPNLLAAATAPESTGFGALFEFTIPDTQLVGGASWYYTSLDQPVQYNGHTYTPAAISFDNKQGAKSDVESTQVSIEAERIEPFLSFVGLGITNSVRVKIYDVFFTQTGQPLCDLVLNGDVTGIERSDGALKIAAQSQVAYLKKKVPAVVFSRIDQRAPYSVAFGIDKAAFARTCQVTAISVSKVTFTSTPIDPEQYFLGGFIEYTLDVSGKPAVVRLAISEHKVTDRQQVTLVKPPFGLKVGDTFTIYAGYDATINQSITRFDNLLPAPLSMTIAQLTGAASGDGVVENHYYSTGRTMISNVVFTDGAAGLAEYDPSTGTGHFSVDADTGGIAFLRKLTAAEFAGGVTFATGMGFLGFPEMPVLSPATTPSTASLPPQALSNFIPDVVSDAGPVLFVASDVTFSGANAETWNAVSDPQLRLQTDARWDFYKARTYPAWDLKLYKDASNTKELVYGSGDRAYSNVDMIWNRASSPFSDPVSAFNVANWWVDGRGKSIMLAWGKYLIPQNGVQLTLGTNAEGTRAWLLDIYGIFLLIHGTKPVLGAIVRHVIWRGYKLTGADPTGLYTYSSGDSNTQQLTICSE